jgi:ATP-dependent helicase HrpB
MKPLPIDPVLPELIASLKRQSNVVLRAPTGAGKTTRVPPALLDAGLAGDKRILLLEPRRLAARAAARRMAQERGGTLGDEVGYQVRFDRKAGSQTRILAITPGLVPRFLGSDPYLESYGVVIFDEFHERGLDNDLALGLVRLIQQTVRPELRIVVMSATLAVEKVAAYLDNCPIITAEGRQYPVAIEHRPRPEKHSWLAAVVQAVRELLDRTEGDMLVFLPGLHEIRQTARQLNPLAQERNLAMLPLHGDLPADQQDAALLPQPHRKVVLATNVAETSVTIEGITSVVDTGLARQLTFDPGLGLDRLQVTPISRSSADQRAGRAGRTQPGVCIRLWSESAHRARPEQTEPEIRRVDLAGAVLELIGLRETDIAHFPWLDPPSEATVQQAQCLLRRLGLIDGKGRTDLGDKVSALPVHPRLARFLFGATGCRKRAALAAALLSERDPFSRAADEPGPQPSRTRTQSDILDRVEALEAFERQGRTETPWGTINRGSARYLFQVRDHILHLLGKEPGADDEPSEDAFLRALLVAYPDRLARRREPGSRRGVMVGGRGVRLAPSSGVIDSELFLCIDVDGRGTEVLVRQASAVQRDWLPSDKLHTTTEVRFDPTSERVMARRQLLFEDLIIEASPAALPDNAHVARVLVEAAVSHLERVLPPSDSPGGLYLLRLRCLRNWMPELDLPLLDEQQLRELITILSRGCRSFADLRKADWLGAIQGLLTHSQRRALEHEVPERLTVPSGSRIALQYEVGRPPVLAVRIQEIFGLRDTPRVVAGRVRVLLHLLAPNYRPQQVTDDLASFWANTYPQVRKELRARYPKHAWPEDPFSAVAKKK